MSLSIHDSSIWYGPTPLASFSGESVGFRFEVEVDTPAQYSQIEALVTIYDSSNQQVVAELSAIYPSSERIQVQMAWGTQMPGALQAPGDLGRALGGSIPPGDYAPTFGARAGATQVSKPSCTGITVLPPPGRRRGRCKHSPCQPRWSCPKTPRDATLVSGPDTPLPGGESFEAGPEGQPGLAVPTTMTA